MITKFGCKIKILYVKIKSVLILLFLYGGFFLYLINQNNISNLSILFLLYANINKNENLYVVEILQKLNLKFIFLKAKLFYI